MNDTNTENKIGVLVSGGGTNLQSIIDNIHFGDCSANIECVISNKPNVYALTRAEQASIPTHVVQHNDYTTRQGFEQSMIALLDQHSVNMVILAGFMRVLESHFIERYLGRILNIHPSLLPKFSGLHTHQRALEAGENTHGCSVHFATAELDGGPVIIQASVPVLNNDTEETLAARVLEKEHIIYPLCIEWLCENKIAYQNGMAYFQGTPLNVPLQLDQLSSDSV